MFYTVCMLKAVDMAIMSCDNFGLLVQLVKYIMDVFILLLS